MKIVCHEDCGNAPRKLLLRDNHIDYWQGDGRQFLDNVAHDAVWDVIGAGRCEGEAAIRDHMARGRGTEPVSLAIHHIITHGKTASLNATVVFKDGSRVEYCDVYTFAGAGRNAKVKQITTYKIEFAAT